MPRHRLLQFAALSFLTAATALVPASAQSAPPPPPQGHGGPGGPGAPGHSTPTQRLEASIDAQRLPLLEKLLPKLNPNCPIRATKRDVKQYIALWRKRTGEPAGSPQDVEASEVQIHIWKMYHCVATYYDGHRYISSPEITGGAPDMGWLEPSEALSQFFHTAKDKGLLHFPTDKEREYFFARYDDQRYANMYDSGKAFTWFHTPPWAKAGPADKTK